MAEGQTKKLLTQPVYGTRLGERPSGEVIIPLPFKLFRELDWNVEDELELVPIDGGTQLVVRKRESQG